MHIDDRVIFIHNLRTSGTSTRRALLHGRDPNEHKQWPWKDRRNGKHAFARMVRPHFSAEDWSSRFKFSIVRNPFDRLVSLYGLFRRPTEPSFQKNLKHISVPYKLDKLVRALRHPDVSLKMSKKEKLDLHEMAFGLGFKDWLRFCDEYQWNACRALDVDAPMTRIQQVEWFDGLDRVFRFEQLDELHDCLVGKGYPVPVRENATVHEPWESYFDNETYDWAAKVFADDIERFGY